MNKIETRGRKRTTSDGHKITQNEANRRHQEKIASIDKQFDDAFAQINWQRRNDAEKDIVKWVNTYGLGLLLEDAPPPKGEEVLRHMDNVSTSHKWYQILMGRGNGKSSYSIITTLFALATGKHKYVMIIANNASASNSLMDDMWKFIIEPDTVFSQDYPEVCLPYQITKGSFRRRQTYKGISTELKKNSRQFQLPRLKKNDNEEFITSGSIVTIRSINGAIRGAKKGILRPTLLLMDDIQDAELAESPERVAKMLNFIKKDIIPLGGKQRITILNQATPIAPDDVIEQLKNDKNWITDEYPVFKTFPVNAELWKQYFILYDSECIDQLPHTESLNFYKEHQQEMDLGADIFNPTRFSTSDGHISAIQKFMELKHAIGEEAFDAEYQMKPHRASYSLVVSPKYIKNKVTNTKVGEIPDGHILTVASTDLNLSKYCTTTIWTFKRDMTAVCIYHHLTKCNIDMKLSDAEYNRQVVQVLEKVGREIKATGIPLFGWAIDANGVPYTAVTDFCKTSKLTVGIQATGFIGKASHMFNGFVRSRLRNEINRTVLCGDAQEQVKAGAGRKYTFWDSDLYREMVQRAMMSPLGISGGASLYKGSSSEHDEFVMQFCNEQLKFVKRSSDGRNHYEWQSKEPHDYLDSSAQAFALAASLGISGTNYGQTTKTAPKQVMKKRVRYKIV